MKKFQPFQIRWNEPLGKAECPYAYRYSFIFLGFGIRIHRWIRSDDKRYFHNHPWWFFTIVLKGGYTDVSYNPSTGLINRDKLSFLSFRFRQANHLHYVDVPKSGAITFLFTGRANQKWGFWLKNRIMRPLRFFSRYGHPPCSEQ